MLPLSLARIAEITGGVLHDAADPEAVVTAPLAFDSRLPMPGGLFLALAGDGRDGHDYAADAVAAGAVGVLASRPVGVPAVVVPDVLAGAAALTAALCAQLTHTSVIGLTGSSGKTSTKDLLAQLLPDLGPTVATEQSFNNEFGVPVTVSRADEKTRFLVVEMGARGIGHIRTLTAMAPLQTGIVLNVGSAHLGEFGSREQIALAKGELIEDLPADGWAVLNADDPLVSAMAPRTRATVVRFGLGPDAQVRAEDVKLDDSGRARFVLHTPHGSASVRLGLVGLHHVANALAATAAALPYGMTPQGAADALSRAKPLSAGRMQIVERADGVTVVNDAYNANPESVRAALDALASMTRDSARPAVAVLGTMRELGEHSEEAHRGVAAYAADLGIPLIAYGPGPEPRWLAARGGSAHVQQPDELFGLLDELLAKRAGIALFKASRDSGLRPLADAYAAR